eukprot:6490524-Amphidinium_carterae.1
MSIDPSNWWTGAQLRELMNQDVEISLLRGTAELASDKWKPHEVLKIHCHLRSHTFDARDRTIPAVIELTAQKLLQRHWPVWVTITQPNLEVFMKGQSGTLLRAKYGNTEKVLGMLVGGLRGQGSTPSKSANVLVVTYGPIQSLQDIREFTERDHATTWQVPVPESSSGSAGRSLGSSTQMRANLPSIRE